jgi:hypothetical protein
METPRMHAAAGHAIGIVNAAIFAEGERLEKELAVATAALASLLAAVSAADPVLAVMERRLQSSLSCDSRSHEGDREPLRLVRELRVALAACRAMGGSAVEENRQ